jgi:formamidopyrimidine-DNA glycosylase
VPELPEVETVCRGLNRLTLGQVIQGGAVLHRSTLAYPFSVDQFWQQLQGTTLEHWQRRGKYLLANLSKQGKAAGYLGIHLRMTGQLLWQMPEDDKEISTRAIAPHTRLYLQFEQGQVLAFVDIRTFGRIWGIAASETPTSVISGLQKLGPEPFAPEFSAVYLQQKLKKSQRPIKTALLDQSLVAGLGNIYADEVLFKCGLQPTTPASQISLGQWEQLHQAIITVLEMAIAAGGTTFSDFRDVTGINGNYGGLAWVYGRKGEPCRVCGTVIERIKLAGRSSHFCPHCQL